MFTKTITNAVNGEQSPKKQDILTRLRLETKEFCKNVNLRQKLDIFT